MGVPSPRRAEDGRTIVRVLVVALALALGSVAMSRASETGLDGDEGYPRARFPLTVHVTPTGDVPLDEAVARAVGDWNALFADVFGTAAFRTVERAGDAQVLVTVESAGGTRLMGETHLDVDGGIITPPVRIVLFTPTARGQTSRELVLYQVAAHELGHAVGLPHTRDPRSLMCCVPGAIDFKDPVARDTYIEARRHPDVRSVRQELTQHYEKFWKNHP
jgi:matrixin